MFDKNPIFDASCALRPIKAIDPYSLLEADTDSSRLYLTTDAKLLWFYQFCNEQGFKGRVDTQLVSVDALKDIQFPDFVGGIASVFKETWTATIYINDEAVATAMSSGTFTVNDVKERDDASWQLQKRAIGAALSQAGFGVISGFNMSENDIEKLRAAGLAAPANAEPASATPPATASGQTVIQNDFFGQNPQQPAVHRPVTTAPATAPAAPAPEVDPLTAAKQVIWHGGGVHSGKTLGEILGAPGGIRTIEWFVYKFAPHEGDEQGHRVQEAAKLILASVSTGK